MQHRGTSPPPLSYRELLLQAAWLFCKSHITALNQEVTCACVQALLQEESIQALFPSSSHSHMCLHFPLCFLLQSSPPNHIKANKVVTLLLQQLHCHPLQHLKERMNRNKNLNLNPSTSETPTCTMH